MEGREGPFIFKGQRWVEEMGTRDKEQMDRTLESQAG